MVAWWLLPFTIALMCTVTMGNTVEMSALTRDTLGFGAKGIGKSVRRTSQLEWEQEQQLDGITIDAVARGSGAGSGGGGGSIDMINPLHRPEESKSHPTVRPL